MYNVVVPGAQIVDGTGGPSYPGDLAVAGDRIAAVGRVGDAAARRVIDADSAT
jgi:N-acyl-D-aspartate/D-glutamate deacylase